MTRGDGETVRIQDGTVCLRDWSPADLGDRLRMLLDPARSWHRTNGPYFGLPSQDDVEAIHDGLLRTAGTPPGDLPVPRRSLAVDHDGELVGSVSWFWEDERTDWRRLGIVLYDSAVRGRGVGTRALRLWTSYLFATTDALRLDLATYSGNEAMVRVARRLGFREEARLRRARRWSGGTHDALVFGVLREEWTGLLTTS